MRSRMRSPAAGVCVRVCCVPRVCSAGAGAVQPRVWHARGRGAARCWRVLAGADGVRFPRRRCVPEAGRLGLRVRGPLQHTGWAGGGGLPYGLSVSRGRSLVPVNTGWAAILSCWGTPRYSMVLGYSGHTEQRDYLVCIYEMVSLLCLRRWGINRFYTMVQCILPHSSEFRVLRNCQTLAPLSENDRVGCASDYVCM